MYRATREKKGLERREDGNSVQATGESSGKAIVQLVKRTLTENAREKSYQLPESKLAKRNPRTTTTNQERGGGKTRSEERKKSLGEGLTQRCREFQGEESWAGRTVKG